MSARIFVPLMDVTTSPPIPMRGLAGHRGRDGDIGPRGAAQAIKRTIDAIHARIALQGAGLRQDPP